MKISRLSAKGLNHEYKVVVPAADIDKSINERLTIIGQNAKIPGFRPGMIPAAVLKQRYGNEAVQDAVEKTIRNSISQVAKENDLRHAAQPKVTVEAFDVGKDLELKIDFELLPEIEVKGFDKIKLEKLIVDIPEKEVKDNIENLVKKHRKFSELEKPRAAKEGDLIHVNVDVTIDGKPFPGFEKHMHVIAGNDEHLISGALEKKTIGVNAGDKLTVTEKFPKDFGNKELAGKEPVFSVEVTKIEQPVKVELNDTLAKDFGCETVDELQKRVRESLEKEYGGLARMRLKRHLLDALAETYTFDLPNSLVENEFNMIWKRLQDELATAKANGTLEEDDNRSEKELKEEYQSISERRVRLGLLISEIARVNKVKVEDQEVRQAIFQEAMRYPKQMKQVIEFYQKTPQAVDQIAAPILEDKVVDFILGKVNLTEKKVKVEELFKLIQGVVPGYEKTEEPAPKKAAKAATTKTEAKSTKVKV